MIIVAAGVSTRFEGEKILAEVAGRPLIAHTISTVMATVDRCVVVCRHDRIRDIESLGFGCELVPGGDSRTASEMAGLAALDDQPDLIGIHDGARPAVTEELIDLLFHRAAAVGGAVPVVPPGALVIDRETHQPLPGVMAVQTPQVFGGGLLMDVYGRAARDAVTGHDTVELVTMFSDTQIASVAGEETNIKVTYPGDLKRVEFVLIDRVRSGPQ